MRYFLDESRYLYVSIPMESNQATIGAKPVVMCSSLEHHKSGVGCLA